MKPSNRIASKTRKGPQSGLLRKGRREAIFVVEGEMADR
jgi:hypothetical protein